MYNHLLYILYWAVNTLVIKLAFILFPLGVVLGTYRLNPTEAAIYAGFWVTFIIWTAWDFAIARKISLEKPVKNFVYFLIVNTVAVWIVTRFAPLSGMGIISFWWAIVIGIIISILHKLVKRVILER